MIRPLYRTGILQKSFKPKARIDCNSMNFISKGLHEHSDPRWKAVDNYVRPHLQPESNPLTGKLAAAARLADEAGLPDICVSSYQGQFLSLQCKLLNAKNVLEVGTLGGYSSIHMASSSPDTKVLTLEIDPTHAEVAAKAIAGAGFADQVKIVLGAAVDKLPGIKEDVLSGKRPKFDMVFIDADKPNNTVYYNYAVEICRRGALIIVDNVVRRGALADDKVLESDGGVKGARAVIERAGKDERVFSTLIQTVGEKSYDGMLLCVVN